MRVVSGVTERAEVHLAIAPGVAIVGLTIDCFRTPPAAHRPAAIFQHDHNPHEHTNHSYCGYHETMS